MLDDIIRRSILERERKKKQWQPEPLYLPVDDYVPLPIKTPEKVPDDEIKRGIIIIETAGYNYRYN